jgi:hypothetical protein
VTSVNVIFGISNVGEFFYTVNCGRTNSDTFFYFVMKVVDKLNNDDLDWRENTIFMLDNASYHRGQISQDRFEKHRIPILYLGPYHFKLAPIELMFSFIKSRNLNPLLSKTNSK